MNERTLETNEADMEVELTAVDLVALSVADAHDAPRSDANARPTSPARQALSKIALPTGLLLAAVAAGGALYTRDANQATQVAAVAKPAPAPMPDWVAESADPPAEPAPEPVRFTNPFDKTEVFDFPPGTTRAEAREAVAQLLLERAAARRAVDPKLRKKHVPQ